MDGGSWPAGHLILAYDAHAACLSLKYSVHTTAGDGAGRGRAEDEVAGMREDGFLPSAAVRVWGNLAAGQSGAPGWSKRTGVPGIFVLITCEVLKAKASERSGLCGGSGGGTLVWVGVGDWELVGWCGQGLPLQLHPGVQDAQGLAPPTANFAAAPGPAGGLLGWDLGELVPWPRLWSEGRWMLEDTRRASLAMLRPFLAWSECTRSKQLVKLNLHDTDGQTDRQHPVCWARHGVANCCSPELVITYRRPRRPFVFPPAAGRDRHTTHYHHDCF